jgi:hypothetical protein
LHEKYNSKVKRIKISDDPFFLPFIESESDQTVNLLLLFTSVSANFGLIGRPREREADTEESELTPYFYRRSPLVRQHTQFIALIHGTLVYCLIRRTVRRGITTHDPWINSRVSYRSANPPVHCKLFNNISRHLT